MLETPHSVIGAAVGAAAGNPAAAAPAAIASHFAGDVVPHWNPNFPFRSKALYAFVIGDFVIAEALTVLLWFMFPDRPEIAIGAFAGTVPDIILGVRFLFRVRWLRGYERFHGKLHWEVPLRYGLWPQLVITAVAAGYLLTIPS